MREKNLFSAGAAKGDITPEENLFPLPFFGPIKINRIDSRLHVRALALGDGERKSLLITVDLTMILFMEELLKNISEETGIPKEYIFVAATHTHEAPIVGMEAFAGTDLSTDDDEEKKKIAIWAPEMKKVIVETAKQAISNMKPAKLGYGTGKSYINVNRDALLENGKSELGNNYERPSDKTLHVVRIEDLDGKVIAWIINYAVHAVAMNGCLIDGCIGINSDIPGNTADALEEKQPDAVALWTSGAAGDQNPRNMTNYGNQMVNGELKYCNIGETGYLVLDALVKEHVRDILAVDAKIECKEKQAGLYGAEKIVKCPLKDMPDQFLPYVLRIFMIGDLAFEGVSAEVVTSIGKAACEVSPYRKTMMITHALGYCGYVADEWEYEHEAFEVGNSPVAKGTAQPLFEEGFQELFRGERNR